MFLYAQNFVGVGLQDWLVSSVTDFSYMFGYAEQFNAPIGNWNTQSAQTMAAMFYGAISFNQALNWSTSGVTDFTKFLVRLPTSQRQINRSKTNILLRSRLLDDICHNSNKLMLLIVA